MATKKDKSVEPIAEVTEEAVVEEAEPATEHDDFMSRKLKAINNMQKPAKAQRLANRLLRKARN